MLDATGSLKVALYSRDTAFNSVEKPVNSGHSFSANIVRVSYHVEPGAVTTFLKIGCSEKGRVIVVKPVVDSSHKLIHFGNVCGTDLIINGGEGFEAFNVLTCAFKLENFISKGSSQSRHPGSAGTGAELKEVRTLAKRQGDGLA